MRFAHIDEPTKDELYGAAAVVEDIGVLASILPGADINERELQDMLHLMGAVLEGASYTLINGCDPSSKLFSVNEESVKRG